MTDAEIIEAMAQAYRETMGLSVEDAMRGLFQVCAPAIRAQAMEEAADAVREYGKHWNVVSIEGWVCSGAVAAIRALAPPAVDEKGESVDWLWYDHASGALSFGRWPRVAGQQKYVPAAPAESKGGEGR